MQPESSLPISTPRNRSIGAEISAWVLPMALIAACLGNATAATPEQLKPWLGCYEIAISTDERAVDTRLLRLTDSPVEGTEHAYVTELGNGSDDEGVTASWWPYSKTSIQLNFADGSVVWAARLTSFGKSIVGAGAWSTDNGRSVTQFHVSAAKRLCDP